MRYFKSFFFAKMLLLVFIAVVNIGGCGGDISKGFNCCAAPRSIDLEMETKDSCFLFEEIELSECPASDVLDVCEPYLCEGCTSEFCFDFYFPDAFVGCEVIDCHTIDCDGVYDIQVDGYPSWTTLIDTEEVQVNCHTQYWGGKQ